MDSELLTAGPARWRRYLGFAELIGPRVLPLWRPDGAAFAFREASGAWSLVDVTTGTVATWFDPERLRMTIGGDPPNTLGFAEDGRLRCSVGGVSWTVDLETYTAEVVQAAESDRAARAEPRVLQAGAVDGMPPTMEVASPTGESLLTQSGDNLGIRELVDDRVRPLTDDGEPQHAWTAAGARFSPNGLLVVVQRVDRRGLPELPVVHWLQQYEQVEYRRLGKTGSAPPPVQWAVIDVLSRRRTVLDLASEEGRSVSVARWQPQGDRILLISQDVTLTSLRLLVADPVTGDSRIAFEDDLHVSDMDYTRQTSRPVAAAAPLAGGKEFLHLTEDTGWCHLAIRDVDSGDELRRLTAGRWPVDSVVSVDLAERVVYFTARTDPTRPYDRHLCRVDDHGGGFRQLTERGFDNQVQAGPSRRHFVVTSSTVARPSVTRLVDGDGGGVTVTETDMSSLEELRHVPPQEFTVPAADGQTQLHGVLYLPPNFDREKSYPILEQIYGGPQIVAHPTSYDGTSATLPNGESIGYGIRAQAHAQLGFVVAVLDGRGTPGRGLDFHRVVRGRMGQHEAADHAAAVRALAADRPWMDLERVGVTGGSWGGYMTLRCMLTEPDLYKVGVATMFVADHMDHSAGIVGIMDTPANNPEGYRLGDNGRVADRLRGKLLMIQGTSDVNATFSAAMKMADAFIQAGRPFDLLVIPEATHHPSGQRADYRQAAVARYFVEHLRPEGVDFEDIPLTGSRDRPAPRRPSPEGA